MAETTKIEWTEATWNPITGCSLASPGCTNCYAMLLAGTRLQHHWSREGLTRMSGGRPKWTGEVRFNEQWLDQPLRWKRPRMIFVCAHGDLFHESVPDEWIDQVFAIMILAHQHTFQVLTKRAARMREYLSRHQWHRWSQIGRTMDRKRWEKLPPIVGGDCTPLPNVWLGVSAEDQQRWDERTDALMMTPAAVRWASVEPMLGPIIGSAPADETYRMLSRWYGPNGFDETGSQPELDRMQGYFPRLDWVVCGGESGPGARPMHPGWARSLRDQCAKAGVPFFFKQWGEWTPCEAIANSEGSVDIVPPISFRNVHRWRRWDGEICREANTDESVGEFLAPGVLAIPTGKAASGRLLDGVQHDGMPG